MRQLTPRETVIVAVAVILGVTAPLYRFVFLPEFDALAALNRRIAIQSRTLATVEAAANRLPAVERDHAAAAARVGDLERRMPSTISVSGLIGRLSVAIAESGVQLNEITFPGGTQPTASATAPVQELPFTVRFRGTFARMVAFLQLLEAPPATASEQSLSIADGGPPAAGGPGGGNPSGLEVTLSMKAFALR